MTKRERDAFIRNRRPMKQQRLDKSEEVPDWIERRAERLKKEKKNHVKGPKSSD